VEAYAESQAAREHVGRGERQPRFDAGTDRAGDCAHRVEAICEKPNPVSEGSGMSPFCKPILV
jgi:hypothetical protein